MTILSKIYTHIIIIHWHQVFAEETIIYNSSGMSLIHVLNFQLLGF